MKSEWLQNIKPGDPVIVISGYPSRERLNEVERLTKTQIVLKGTAIKYRRRDGHKIGESSWTFGCIAEATQERIAKIEEESTRRSLLAKIDNQNFRDLDTAQLEEIVVIIERKENEAQQRSHKSTL